MTENTPKIPLKVWVASPDAWNLAVTKTVDAATAESGKELSEAEIAAAWKEIEKAGVGTADGTLDPMWRAIIGQTMTAWAVIRVTSTYNGLAYVADVSLGDQVTTCLTRRLAVEEDDAGILVPTGADPQVEFAITTANNPWDLVRRVLPPLDELRAFPRQCHADERVPHILDADALKRIRTSLDQPGLAPVVCDALDAKATVMVTMLVSPPGADDEYKGLALRAWAVGENGLYAFERAGDGASVTRVEPGDVGFNVLWLTLGAQDLVYTAALEEGEAR